MTWLDYVERHPSHSVVGTLKQRDDVYSPQLDNHRSLLVWLPPDYAHSSRRYPVLYLHDGQNLFDRFTSYAGEWQVDETMQRLSAEGYPAIIVGIPNMGSQRINEYSPFADPKFGGGQGDRYLAFLVETVKPLIDHDFRTLSEREHTGLVGSSMGGLISLYGFFRHPSVFGGVGAMSPSFWFARGAIFPYIRQASYQPGAVYLDVGGREGPIGAEQLRRPGQPNQTMRRTQEMHRLLQAKGYHSNSDLLYVEAAEATHSEAAWAERLPRALRFLLGRLSAKGRAQNHAGWPIYTKEHFMEQLSQAQRQYLRKVAHDLRPVVQLGKQGLTPNVLATIDHALDAHELIKLKFLDFQDEKQELAEQIAQELNGHLVSVVGNVAIFYREQPNPDRRIIELPARK